MAINFLNVGAFPDDVKLTFGGATDYEIYHNSTTNVNHISSLLDRQLSVNANIIQLTNQANSTTYLKLESTEATFTTDVRLPAAGKLYTWTGGNDNYLTYNSWYIWTGSDIIIRNSSTGPFKFQTNGANDVLTLDSSQNATFAGSITIPEYINHTGDGNTNFGFGGADDFRVTVGGTKRLNVITTGVEIAGNLTGGTDASFAGTITVGSAGSIFGENVIRFKSSGAAYIDHNTTSQSIKFRLSNSSSLDVTPLEITPSYLVAAGDILVGADSTYDLGATANRWANIWVDSINGGAVVSGSYLPLAGGTMTGDVIYDDNVKIKLGSGGGNSDIYHNGTDMYIRNLTTVGDLSFAADSTGSGGAATAYFWLDGGVVKTRVAKDMNFETSVKASFGNVSTPGMMIWHDGSNGSWQNDIGDIYIRQAANDKDIILLCDDGSGGHTAYLTLDGSVGYTTVQKDIRFEDNVQLELGTDRELTIYSDGSNGLITNQIGDLYITNAADDESIIFQTDNGSGGVATYMTIDGANEVTSFQKHTKHEDNIAAYFGNGSDLRIYHDASNSYIDQTGAGHLYIRNTVDDKNIYLQTDDGSGGVATYIKCDGLQNYTEFPVNTRHMDNVYAQFGNSNDAYIVHNGTNWSFVNHVDDGDINFSSDDGSGGTATYMYLDGGNTRVQFNKDARFIDSTNILLGTSDDARIYHDGIESTYFKVTAGDLYIRSEADDQQIYIQGDDGSGGVANYLTIDGNVGYTIAGKDIRFNDTISAAFGTGIDAFINHSGSSFNIYNDIGAMNFIQRQNDGNMVFQSDDGSGGTATYFSLDGGSSATNELYTKWPDNSRIALGSGKDLQLYHNGSDSYITNATGILYVRAADNFVITNSTGSENVLIATPDGAVKLYYNASNKLETNTTGITVNGDVTATTLTLSGKGTSAATVDGDGSTTLTTKGYVDSLITGATLYQGTWDPSSGTYGSPDLSTASLQVNGYYYICSANGSATPNGAGTEPDSWHTGDWVIWNDDLGASGQWQKIDNTTVLSGAGTGEYLARWTDTETLGDSVLLASGSDILMPQYIKHTGDTDTYFGFSAANTYKVHTGGSDRFSVAGDVHVLGTTDFAIPAGRKLYLDGQGNTYLTESAADTIKIFTGGTEALEIDSSQDATFADNVTVTNNLTANLLYTDFIQTRNGAKIDFRHQDASVIMTVDTDDARVGIGTTSPGNKLHIVSGDEDTLRLEATSGQPAIFWYPDGSVKWEERASASTWQLYSYDESEWVFNLYNGKCGIGTTTPSEKLHVSTESNTVAKFESTDGNANIRVSDTQDNAHLGTVDGKTFIGPDTSTGGNNITILSNGKVGIGDANPAAKLEVSGGIIAGGKTIYTLSYPGGVTTTGTAVAGLSGESGGNGASSGFIFTCFGGEGYQRIVYSCRNVGGTWDIDKDIDEGVNAFDVTHAADGSDNITFTFKARSSTQSYTPRVTVEAIGSYINQSYIN